MVPPPPCPGLRGSRPRPGPVQGTSRARWAGPRPPWSRPLTTASGPSSSWTPATARIGPGIGIGRVPPEPHLARPPRRPGPGPGARGGNKSRKPGSSPSVPRATRWHRAPSFPKRASTRGPGSAANPPRVRTPSRTSRSASSGRSRVATGHGARKEGVSPGRDDHGPAVERGPGGQDGGEQAVGHPHAGWSRASPRRDRPAPHAGHGLGGHAGQDPVSSEVAGRASGGHGAHPGTDGVDARGERPQGRHHGAERPRLAAELLFLKDAGAPDARAAAAPSASTSLLRAVPVALWPVPGHPPPPVPRGPGATGPTRTGRAGGTPTAGQNLQVAALKVAVAGLDPLPGPGLHGELDIGPLGPPPGPQHHQHAPALAGPGRQPPGHPRAHGPGWSDEHDVHAVEEGGGRLGPQGPGPGDEHEVPEVHPELGTGHHPRVGHAHGRAPRGGRGGGEEGEPQRGATPGDPGGAARRPRRRGCRHRCRRSRRHPVADLPGGRGEPRAGSTGRSWSRLEEVGRARAASVVLMWPDPTGRFPCWGGWTGPGYRSCGGPMIGHYRTYVRSTTGNSGPPRALVRRRVARSETPEAHVRDPLPGPGRGGGTGPVRSGRPPGRRSAGGPARGRAPRTATARWRTTA